MVKVAVYAPAPKPRHYWDTSSFLNKQYHKTSVFHYAGTINLRFLVERRYQKTVVSKKKKKKKKKKKFRYLSGRMRPECQQNPILLYIICYYIRYIHAGAPKLRILFSYTNLLSSTCFYSGKAKLKHWKHPVINDFITGCFRLLFFPL